MQLTPTLPILTKLRPGWHKQKRKNHRLDNNLLRSLLPHSQTLGHFFKL